MAGFVEQLDRESACESKSRIRVGAGGDEAGNPGAVFGSEQALPSRCGDRWMICVDSCTKAYTQGAEKERWFEAPRGRLCPVVGALGATGLVGSQVPARHLSVQATPRPSFTEAFDPLESHA